MSRLVLLLLVAALTGCATSGPKYLEVKDSIPALDPTQGRIYFYRPGVIGALVKPNIQLDGTVVGEMVPQGFFFVDRPAGTYLATARTESEATVEVPLQANQTQYVKGSISIGIFVGRPNLVLMNPSDALIEITDLVYTGTTMLQPGAAGAASARSSPAPAASGGPTNLKDLEGLLEKETDKK